MLIIRKPSLWSRDVPHKIRTQSQLFWRLLDTNGQTDKPNLYIDYPLPPHKWCIAPEFFVLISSHCSEGGNSLTSLASIMQKQASQICYAVMSMRNTSKCVHV